MPIFATYRFSASVAAMSYSAFLLAGCQTPGERMMARARQSDTCVAKRLQTFVGRSADNSTVTKIEASVSKSRHLRCTWPGDEILADLNTGRITTLLYGRGAIQSIGCYLAFSNVRYWPSSARTPNLGRSTFVAHHLTADIGLVRNSRLVPMLPEQDLTVFGRLRLIKGSAFL